MEPQLKSAVFQPKSLEIIFVHFMAKLFPFCHEAKARRKNHKYILCVLVAPSAFAQPGQNVTIVIVENQGKMMQIGGYDE